MNLFSLYYYFLILLAYIQEYGGGFFSDVQAEAKLLKKTGEVCQNVIYNGEDMGSYPKCLVLGHSGRQQMNVGVGPWVGRSQSW